MLRQAAHKMYTKYIRSRIKHEISRQRLKLFWFVWGYLPILRLSRLPLIKRLYLLQRFIAVDWNVVHGHRPAEINVICGYMVSKGKTTTESVFVEAGCWNGGSSAKFSILCELFGYKLHIYDSFQGVKPIAPSELIPGDYDYSGEYKATSEVVVSNISKYGHLEVCTLHPGWFSDTIAKTRLDTPIQFVYIDCDVAQGTFEVLQGVSFDLTQDAVIFSQDYHINSVQRLLDDTQTWSSMNLTSHRLINRPVYNLMAFSAARLR